MKKFQQRNLNLCKVKVFLKSMQSVQWDLLVNSHLGTIQIYWLDLIYLESVPYR